MVDYFLGRTLLTYRVLLEQEQAIWFKKAKKSSTYYSYTQELLGNAQKFADSITFWRNGQVKEKFLFSILFAQYKELQQLKKLK